MIPRLLALCARVEGHAAQRALLEDAAACAEWAELPALAEQHGLGPLVGFHLRAAAVSLPSETQRALQAQYVRHRRANAIRAGVLLEIKAALERSGIDNLWLKGVALARTVYPDPGLRPMRDIDLLVRPTDTAGAAAIMKDLGFEVPAQAPRQPAAHHHLTVVARPTDGLLVSVEIHRDVLPTRTRSNRFPTFDTLFKRAAVFEVNGVTLRTLAHDDMLWHVYRHAFGYPFLLESFRLIHVADMVSLVERYADQIDWSAFAAKCPCVMHALPLLHGLTPWRPETIARLGLKVAPLPAGVGREFDGWPKRPYAAQRAQGKILWKIAKDTLFPSPWWLALHYGISSWVALLWYRWVRHPLQMLLWLRRGSWEWVTRWRRGVHNAPQPRGFDVREAKSLDQDGRPRRKPDYRLEQLDDELLLYHLNEARIVYFNATASLIWQLCDGTRTMTEIAQLLCDAFPEDAETIPTDVRTTLEQFQAADCVHLA